MLDHPLHPAVEMLAGRYGVGLLSKLIWRKHIYDGKNVRLWWYGRLEKRAIKGLTPLSDHDVAHEVAHFVAAAPEQRDLPEFGLGYGALYGQAFVWDVVDKDEAEIQEMLAQLICMHWGRKYNFGAIMSDEPEYVWTWDDYEQIKRKEHSEDDHSAAREKAARERFETLLRDGII
jgi:hypothetical protein